MDAAMVKAIFGLMSVFAGLGSCVFWYRSSKAEVLWEDRADDDIGIEAGGKSLAMFATAKKQSSFGAKGALAAAIAALLQLIPLLIDAVTTHP